LERQPYGLVGRRITRDRSHQPHPRFRSFTATVAELQFARPQVNRNFVIDCSKFRTSVMNVDPSYRSLEARLLQLVNTLMLSAIAPLQELLPLQHSSELTRSASLCPIKDTASSSSYRRGQRPCAQGHTKTPCPSLSAGLTRLKCTAFQNRPAQRHSW
jgi:hypothetical protein